MKEFYPDLRLKEIPQKQIFARLGYRPGLTQLSPQDKSIIQKLFRESRRFIQPRFAYVSGQIKIPDSGQVVIDGLRIVSNDLANLLQNCFRAYGLAITIGRELERWRDRLRDNKEMREAIIVDAIGSEVVEELTNDFNRQLNDWLAKDGYKTTRRFSCGYGDWSISGQKDFIDWLGAKNIGISIRESFQLVPEKSVTALIGVYNEKK